MKQETFESFIAAFTALALSTGICSLITIKSYPDYSRDLIVLCIMSTFMILVILIGKWFITRRRK